MLPIGSEVRIPLTIIYIKTNDNLTGRRSKQPKIRITGIDIVMDWPTSYTENLPGSRVYPLPVRRKVHIINFWVAFICRIGISCKMDDVTDCRAYRANPCAPRFYMDRRTRTLHIHDNSKSKREHNRCSDYSKYE